MVLKLGLSYKHTTSLKPVSRSIVTIYLILVLDSRILSSVNYVITVDHAQGSLQKWMSIQPCSQTA
jgi:hypothetical protein